ncbi:MAG: hypothetical protein H6627_13725 [Calditrichae bacterium]|nr:hypothetical protein [Calditrichota bacterium]MCB9059627.1 hypothetical protein [Calditrichia bacterium]
MRINIASDHVNNFFFTKLLMFLITLLIFINCSSITDSDSEKDDTLYVKFTNSSSSQYTITSIELQAMGKADETAVPSGTWSENILKDGKKLAPGEFDFFTLDIPTLHFSVYRLGVDTGNGTQLLLYTQENYQGLEPTITHWGSDDRTVEVTVIYDQSSSQVVVNGWSEWAGID